jgi:hypothetical protein
LSQSLSFQLQADSCYIASARTTQKTQLLYCCMAQMTQKKLVTYQIASSLVGNKHWAWRGQHGKHSLIYFCVLNHVYRTFALATRRSNPLQDQQILKNFQICWTYLAFCSITSIIINFFDLHFHISSVVLYCYSQFENYRPRKPRE